MKKYLVLSLLLAICLTPMVYAQGSYELDRAKRAMEAGEYSRAIDHFRHIARSYDFSRDVKQEAAYYIGFCYVKMRDPWSAITAYEDFLNRYDNNMNTRFVPDALYVLGRTYEEVNRPQDAVRVYRRCIDRFGGEFGTKSRDRLRVLGYGGSNPGGGHSGGGHHPGTGYGDALSFEVREVIELSKSYNNSYTRDEMLLKAAQRKARTATDFYEIGRNISNDFTRGQVLEACVNSTNLRFMSIDSLVRVGRTCKNSFSRDQFLLNLAQKRAREVSEFRILANEAASSFTRQQILDLAQNAILRHSTHRDVAPGYGPGADTRHFADVGPQAPKAEESATDPFRGLTSDKQQIERVSAFMDAVQSKKSMTEAARRLSKDDLNIPSVKASWRTYQEMQKFERMHGN